MSRSDNTMPEWVRAEWWVPRHWRCQDWISTAWQKSSPRRACDLPEEPPRRVCRPYGFGYPGPGKGFGGCFWEPLPTPAQRPGYATPAWFNRLYFTRPARARVREQLTRARAEYRGDGVVDVVTETDQHRHRGAWLYH